MEDRHCQFWIKLKILPARTWNFKIVGKAVKVFGDLVDMDTLSNNNSHFEDIVSDKVPCTFLYSISETVLW